MFRSGIIIDAGAEVTSRVTGPFDGLKVPPAAVMVHVKLKHEAGMETKSWSAAVAVSALPLLRSNGVLEPLAKTVGPVGSDSVIEIEWGVEHPPEMTTSKVFVANSPL